jgi:hypothetical protein
VCAFSAATLNVGTADAADTNEDDRYEWAGLPVISGSTDVGVRFGVIGVLARFQEGYSPFQWRSRMQLTMSAKEGPDGVELPTHKHRLRLDLPGLMAGRLRLVTEAQYLRVINAGYFGLGNASTIDEVGRRHQYLRTEPELFVRAQYRLWRSLTMEVGAKVGGVLIDTYEGSLLREQMDLLSGTESHFAAQLTGALQWDSRDDETAPTRGMLHEISIRASPAFIGTSGLNFGGATLNARFYIPIAGDYLVLATRLFADLLFGDVPFYEMARGGGLDVFNVLGGKNAIRGVPVGRYHGRAKLMANVELRSMYASFGRGKHRIRLGLAAFADVGRVWAGYAAQSDLDGAGAGLKYGLGGGGRLQWGRTVMIRLDVAYSPDALAVNSNLPLGIYLTMGQAY